MITIQACFLYIISSTSVGFVSPGCHVDGTTVLLPTSPDAVYYVHELPKGHVFYPADEVYVNYWTVPTLRINFGSYTRYRTHRIRERTRLRRSTPARKVRRPVRSPITRHRRVSPVRRIGNTPRVHRRINTHRKGRIKKVKRRKNIRSRRHIRKSSRVKKRTNRTRSRRRR